MLCLYMSTKKPEEDQVLNHWSYQGSTTIKILSKSFRALPIQYFFGGGGGAQPKQAN